MINLLKYNRHWENGYSYPFPKNRDYLNNILDRMPLKQIVEISGLRRTGKTTLLMQTINTLLKQDINPLNIWYFTFDEYLIDFDQLLSDFQKQTKKSIIKDKVFIFLDEIQKLPDFQSKLKIYYDLYPELKFVISGSTSLFLRKKIQESLAGRIISLFLKPLSFKEYLYFSERPELLKNPSLFHPHIEKEFEKYWQCQFIETITMDNQDIQREYIISILKNHTLSPVTTLHAPHI